MKPHTWETEWVGLGGPIQDEFWICRVCGASGGPTVISLVKKIPPPSWPPFYADGSQLKLSDDCNEADGQVQRHLRTKPPTNSR